jgi:tellurite resistance protein TehA-like permease
VDAALYVEIDADRDGRMILAVRTNPRTIGRLLDAIPPAAGAEVMATGIVSVALALDREETLSRILLVIAGLTWLALVAVVPRRARRDHARLRAEVRTPAALTSVAATALLGGRLAMLGWTWAGIAALAIAAVVWALLLPPVRSHWTTPTDGSSLLLVVATESLAVLAAMLAASERAEWLLVTALAPLLLGLGFYVFVVVRLPLNHLIAGLGDHWITGGALAISTLAAGKLLTGAKALVILGDGGGVLKTVALSLWVLSMLCLPALVGAELLHPRLRYDVRRWGTVFPFGMYAACSFVIGAAMHSGAITSFAQVWVWVAFAVWAVVLAGMLRVGLRAAS